MKQGPKTLKSLRRNMLSILNEIKKKKKKEKKKNANQAHFKMLK